jgi:dihydrofolate synthase/folylpolyglutamate synthase
MMRSPWWQGLRRFGMKPGLDRTMALLERLDHPERTFSAVHVAGTNGKGSTAAMIASALSAAGVRTGLTTSPDLGDVRERVLINGSLLGWEEWRRLAEAIEEAARPLAEPPTEFEALTALAFLAFRQAGVETAVVEVGLGGRYDATNVLPPPVVTVLTPEALDHEEVLGPTLTAVAEDTAGVIKTGSRVVSAPQAPPVRRVFREAAAAAGVPLTWAGGRLLWSDASGVTVEVGREVVRTRLLGRHQAVNLMTAWAALRVVADRRGLSTDALKNGLLTVNWPGRLEVVRDRPLVMVDAAHNLHGAKALARALTEPHLRRPWHLVFGTLTDKPGARMLRLLLPQVESVLLTRPESSRAMDPHDLAGGVPSAKRPAVVERVEEALREALRRAGADGAVLAAGSFYVVGPVRRAAAMMSDADHDWQDLAH